VIGHPGEHADCVMAAMGQHHVLIDLTRGLIGAPRATLV
jgi:hypothetical protein